MGGVQLLHTKWGYPFIFNGGLQILMTSHYQLQIIKYFKGLNLELSAYKTLLPQLVIKISHAHDETALVDFNFTFLLLMLARELMNK